MKSFLDSYKSEIRALWTPSKFEIRGLNGIRAFSAFAVFLFHVWSGLFSQATTTPGWGEFIAINLFTFVDLFFVLSGFLVYGSLHREFSKSGHISLGNFFKKRALRILPAWYFYLGIAFLMLSTRIIQLEGLENPTPEQVSGLDLFYLARLRNIFDFAYMSDYFLGIHPHSWSLSIEFKFYLIIPLLVPIILKWKPSHRSLFLVGIYLVPLALRFYTHFFNITMPSDWAPFVYEGVESVHIRHQAAGSIYHFFHTRFDPLILGMLLYEFYDIYATKSFKKRYTWAILIASLTLLFFSLSGHFDTKAWIRDTIKYNAFNLAFAGIVFSALQGPDIWKKIWSFNIWTPFARISYSFYLWNMLGSATAIQYIYKHGYQDAPWNFILTGIAGGLFQTTLIALLVYVLIEAPFLAWRNKSRA